MSQNDVSIAFLFWLKDANVSQMVFMSNDFKSLTCTETRRVFLQKDKHNQVS